MNISSSRIINIFASQGIGFVDDTNLITYGPIAAENCRTLEKAHNTCIEWARRHGARFAQEKYCQTVELVCRLIYKEKRLFIHEEGVD
jgi:hypothetical protein